MCYPALGVGLLALAPTLCGFMRPPGAAIFLLALQRDPMDGALRGTLGALITLSLEPLTRIFDLRLDASEVGTPQGHEDLMTV